MDKQTLGVTSIRSPKRAGNIRWASATTGQTRLLTRDVEVTISSRDEVTQKMDVLETMMRDMSVRIKAIEDHLREVGLSIVLYQATSPPAKMSQAQGSLQPRPEE